MGALGVSVGLQVVDSEGRRLGRVASLGAEYFELVRGFFSPQLHLVSYHDVARVGDGEVVLAMPSGVLEELWRVQEDYVEPNERARAIAEVRRRAEKARVSPPEGTLL